MLTVLDPSPPLSSHALPSPFKQPLPWPTTTPPHAPGNHESAFCLYGFVYSRYFIWMGSYNMLPFLSGFFTQHVFCVHPVGTFIKYFIPCYGWIIFYCISHFAYSFISSWAFQLFPTRSFADSAVLRICVQVFVWKSAFKFFGSPPPPTTPRSRIAGS